MIYRFFHFIDRYIGIAAVVLLSVLKHRKTAPSGPRNNILIIKFTMLGDTILLIPALRALKEHNPGISLTVICSEVNRMVLEECPYIDTLIPVTMSRLINPGYLVRLLGNLRNRNFDTVIDFEQWFRISVLITFFAGARYAIGFKTGGQCRHLLFDKWIEHEREKHETECYLDLVSLLGIAPREKYLELRIDNGSRQETEKILAAQGITPGISFIVVHPGSSHWPQKQWPAEKYAALCRMLIEEMKTTIVVTGSRDESGLAQTIQSMVPAGERIVSLAGLLSFRQLAALLERSSVVICGNTGILHLAGAVKAPVVLINGPVSQRKWGIWSDKGVTVNTTMPCAPCVYLGFEYQCARNTCMDAISVGEVYNGVQTVLAGGGLR